MNRDCPTQDEIYGAGSERMEEEGLAVESAVEAAFKRGVSADQLMEAIESLPPAPPTPIPFADDCTPLYAHPAPQAVAGWQITQHDALTLVPYLKALEQASLEDSIKRPIAGGDKCSGPAHHLEFEARQLRCVLDKLYQIAAGAPVPPTGGNGEWSEGQVERACETYYNAQGLKGKRAWADVYWVAKDEYRDWMRAALSTLTPACATSEFKIPGGLTDDGFVCYECGHVNPFSMRVTVGAGGRGIGGATQSDVHWGEKAAPQVFTVPADATGDIQLPGGGGGGGGCGGPQYMDMSKPRITHMAVGENTTAPACATTVQGQMPDGVATTIKLLRAKAERIYKNYAYEPTRKELVSYLNDMADALESAYKQGEGG